MTYLNSSSGTPTGNGTADERRRAASRRSAPTPTDASRSATCARTRAAPRSGWRRRIPTRARYAVSRPTCASDGQRLALDLVLIGHGSVTGVVHHATSRLAVGARVRVVSVTDSQIGVVTTTDSQGVYSVEGMTVGAVTVTAVLGPNLGRGAGTARRGRRHDDGRRDPRRQRRPHGRREEARGRGVDPRAGRRRRLLPRERAPRPQRHRLARAVPAAGRTGRSLSARGGPQPARQDERRAATASPARSSFRTWSSRSGTTRTTARSGAQ